MVLQAIPHLVSDQATSAGYQSWQVKGTGHAGMQNLFGTTQQLSRAAAKQPGFETHCQSCRPSRTWRRHTGC